MVDPSSILTSLKTVNEIGMGLGEKIESHLKKYTDNGRLLTTFPLVEGNSVRAVKKLLEEKNS